MDREDWLCGFRGEGPAPQSWTVQLLGVHCHTLGGWQYLWGFCYGLYLHIPCKASEAHKWGFLKLAGSRVSGSVIKGVWY